MTQQLFLFSFLCYTHYYKVMDWANRSTNMFVHSSAITSTAFSSPYFIINTSFLRIFLEMPWYFSVLACLAQTGPPVLTFLNEGFTFISGLCGCFGITSYQSIFPNGIPRCQEIPSVEVSGEKPTQTLNEIKKLMFNEENNHVSIIGLYGMGGVGKTTLLTELNNEFVKTSHGFDLVIWVVVSKDLDLKNIQDQIGDKLSLSWPEATQIHKRGKDIFKVLNNKKFVLLLDDIWKRVDLQEIGIPYVRNNTKEVKNRSKIVFTTRIKSVCESMGARPIKVKCLDEDEAWNLFHQTVLGAYEPCSRSNNTADDESGTELDPVIRDLAKDIAKECLGLPLALLAIGRAMAGKKELRQWEYALSTLRGSASSFPDMEDEVLCKLKLSYDYLRNGKLKSCFLYCSLYPEDYPIKIEELIDVWIGEGFLNEVCDRLEGRDVVECLKNACLLESCVIEEYGLVEHGVKMHDVIRELAIWVASSGLGEINVKDSIQEQQDLHKWEFAERISLTGSKAVSKLTGAPKCRNLLTLLLRGSEIRTLSDEFFQYMPRLKVLSMPQHLEIDNLPASISSLSGLHYLNLAKTSFSSNATLKPGTFDSLVSLKTLDLYFSNLRNWEKKGGPSLDELERLENLKSLGLTIESDVALKKLVTTVKLQMCTKKLMVEIERGISSISLSPSSPLSPTSVSLANMAGLKILHLRQCSGLRELRIPSTSSVCAEDKVTLCTSLEVLHIQLVAQLDIVCDMLQQSSCFVNLKHVRIMGCHELKDVSWLIYAQNLEILDMGYQNILEEIISYRFPGVTDCDITFRRLQTMKLYELGNLQRICNHNVKFPVLKHITVMYCPKLKKLPFDPRTLRKIEGQKEWWESLVWEDETAKSILTPFFVISKG